MSSPGRGPGCRRFAGKGLVKKSKRLVRSDIGIMAGEVHESGSGRLAHGLLGGAAVQIESMMFVGWVALPITAYVMGRMLIRRSNRLTAGHPHMDATARLAQMRERTVDGTVTRGRMAEAIRLADGPQGPAVLTTRRG